MTASPWHAGELALQRSVGVAEQMDRVGRIVLRPYLPDQHRAFFALLPFIVIGAVDPDGAPWATIRAGHPGFMHSPDPALLAVEAMRDHADPAERGMTDGAPVGLLGIDLATRRRNRLNGRLHRSDDRRFTVEVGQSFGNCPRFITRRQVEFMRDPALPSASPAVVVDALDGAARRIIESADTFFVASYGDTGADGRQVDVSHRGGAPGFVRIGADGSLTVPDYGGNLFFNTLGNFLLNPRAGLLFVDLHSGTTLQLCGKVDIILDSPAIATFEGAERLWRLTPEKIVLRTDALPFRWAP